MYNKLQVRRDLPPQDYWSNTSSNDIVRHFIERIGDGLTKSEIEALVAGETVAKEIHEDLTYNRLYDTTDNIWSVLFTTGYLTQRGTLDGRTYQLAIPNMEIRNIFKNQIMTMFRKNVEQDGKTLDAFCQALQTGNAGELQSGCLRIISGKPSVSEIPLSGNRQKRTFITVSSWESLGTKTDGMYVQIKKPGKDTATLLSKSKTKASV